MHGRHPPGPQIDGGSNGLVRVAVDVTEPPPGVVRTDGQQREVDARVALPDLGEPVAVPRVAREVHALSVGGGEDPAAPEGAAGVGEAALGPVVGGHEVEADAAQFGRFPPVQLGDLGEPAAPEPAREARRYEHRCVAREPAQGRHVQVVVVVVADDDRVDARQRAPGHADGCDPGRGAEDLAGPDRVGEDGEPADADHPTRVPRPGDGDGVHARLRQRPRFERQRRDVGETVGPRSQRALAGEPREGPQPRQRRRQPVREGPRPDTLLAERTGLGEREERRQGPGRCRGRRGRRFVRVLCGRGGGPARARGRLGLLRHRGGSHR